MNAHLERALLLFQQSRHDMAEAELRQALGMEPHEAYPHALLALCLVELEKFDEATSEAQLAIHLQPDFSFSHYVHARVLYARNLLEQARGAIDEAIRLDPEDADYFSLLAGIHFRDSRWQESLGCAEQGLQFDPEHIGCTNLRAVALVKLGRKAEAGATIDAALSKNPENPTTHANQGWTLLEKGETRKAMEHFRESLRLDPDNDWARQGMVEALKARNIVYGLMLRYFLWMTHFSSRGQWAILLGGYLGYLLLGSVAVSYPALAPWILPLRILYCCFALMTWLASPLFNLMLRVNRFGRHVLSREQTIASDWFGVCLLFALLSLAGWCLTHFNDFYLIAALIFGLLLLPVSSVYRCAAGWPRKTMAGVTIGLVLAGLGSIAADAMAEFQGPRSAESNFGSGLFTIFIIGICASTWIANFLCSKRVRR
jgi:Tfp pilus assembly protein PilF